MQDMIRRLQSRLPASATLRLAGLLFLLLGLAVAVSLVQQVARYRLRAIAETVNIFFAPAQVALPPDSSIKLMLDAKSNQIGFARVEVSFDPSLVKLSGEIQTTNLLKTVVQKTSMASANSTGKIVIALGLSPEDRGNPPTGVFELAQLPLTAVTGVSRSTTISIVTSGVQLVSLDTVELPFVSEALLVNLNPAGPTPTPKPSPTPSPTSTPAPTAPPSCHLGTSSWQNFSLAPQTGTFSVEFDVTPNSQDIDALTALSSSPGSTFDDYATLVRFNNGIIDVRNGSFYSADTQVSYTPGTSYHFKQDTNVTNHTYSVWVTPEGGNTQKLATDYAFRTSQNTISSIGNWGIWAGTSSHQVCNFTLSSSTPSLPGDLDGDNDVDIFDYNLLVENFGNTSCGNVADINSDCKVDIFDYNILVENFGK